MILLIDIGNTRIKWTRLDGDQLGVQRAAAHSNWTHEDLIDQVLAPAGPARIQAPHRILASNVGGARVEQLLRSAAARTWQMEVQFVQSSARAAGVVNGYADPAQLGVDRWLAVIGAKAMRMGAACVVDVGTAMTIDGVDTHGQHLGGVIVPGPELMMASLLRNTSDLAQRSQQGHMLDALFADNTRGAIEQGTMHALAALAVRAMEAMARTTGTSPVLLLTGGGSERLAAVLGIPCLDVPDLVLRGLAVLAAEAPP